MRVTYRHSSQIIKTNLSTRAEQLEKAWRQASSGKRVERPSDDPGAVARLLAYRSAQTEIEQRRFQVEQGLSFLTAADTALHHAAQVLVKAQELATASRSGSVSSDDIKTMAVQVEQLLTELQEIAGQKYNGQDMFAPGAVHFSAGDMADFELARQDVFSPAFAALQQLQDELRSDAPAAETTLTALQQAVDHVLNYQAQVGARANRLEAVQQRLTVLEQDLAVRRSTDAEADIVRALIDLKEEEAAYQAALAATARIMQVSLVDYL